MLPDAAGLGVAAAVVKVTGPNIGPAAAGAPAAAAAVTVAVQLSVLGVHFVLVGPAAAVLQGTVEGVLLDEFVEVGGGSGVAD